MGRDVVNFGSGFSLHQLNMTRIFLVRHARPDLNRKDIPYDLHPGPPLALQGEKEAEEVAEFLKTQGVVRLYYSPFERSARTAQIIAARNRIPSMEEKRLTEWRQVDELGAAVRVRMSLVFDEIARESAIVGPIALVSHGGPITFLLLALGMEEDTLSEFKKKFDGFNPLPPAGVWAAEWNPDTKTWNLTLVFIPSTNAEVQ
jgi:broad specificity phosphatase PhoE